MHYDDRLATVLRQPARGEAIARIQYRQLLDLLGTAPGEADDPQTDTAYRLLAELSDRIPAPDRGAVVNDPALRLRNPRLLAILSQGEPQIATAAIAAAQLADDDWLELIPALPIRARGILRHRRDLGHKVAALLERLGIGDRGLPPSNRHNPAADTLDLSADDEIDPPHGNGEIGALVRRIEEFRKARAPAPGSARHGDAPRLPLGDGEQEETSPQVNTIDFATDAQGRLVWAESAAAPMLIGMQLAAPGSDGPARASMKLSSAFRYRQPLCGEWLTIDAAPAISGDWQADATPCFDNATGRFTGYCGRLRRPATAARAPQSQASNSSEGDRMRQILHELRTPLTAIQGGAEVIQQALFGPAPHEYRALAATIASDAAHILAGFDELDRLIRLEGGALDTDEGECDLAEIVKITVKQLQAHTDPRKSGFALLLSGQNLPVKLACADLERLVWRLLAAIAGAAAPSEILELRCTRDAGTARLTIQLPASLAARTDEELFEAKAENRTQALSAGMFGLGFTLRLAAAEAKAASGSLERGGNVLHLALPGLTRTPAGLSQA